jgi:hypothetical protein
VRLQRAGRELGSLPVNYHPSGTKFVQGPNRVRKMVIPDGLYSIDIEMYEGAQGHATGVIVLRGGQILGGDSYFYYTGSYNCGDGKWRGELVTHQHTVPAGLNLVFGGRDVGCGFTGSYTDSGAEVNGTALVGKASVEFRANLTLKVRL